MWLPTCGAPIAPHCSAEQSSGRVRTLSEVGQASWIQRRQHSQLPYFLKSSRVGIWGTSSSHSVLFPPAQQVPFLFLISECAHQRIPVWPLRCFFTATSMENSAKDLHTYSCFARENQWRWPASPGHVIFTLLSEIHNQHQLRILNC